nr:glycoside hydrolase family 2 protein [Candidatus Sigynarchaeota archaeon]
AVPQDETVDWSILNIDGTTLLEGSNNTILPPISSSLVKAVDVRDIFKYLALKLEGRFEVDDGGSLRFLAKDTTKPEAGSASWPAIESALAGVIGKQVELVAYSAADGKPSDRPVTGFLATKPTKFTGACVLDEDGLACIKQQLTPSNPQLFDVPIAEMIEEHLGKDGIVLEIEGWEPNPSIIIACRWRDDGNVLGETFKPFGRPGDLPMLDPKLEWKILSGSGRDWKIEITTHAPAIHVFFASDDLDFWLDDNFFLMRGGKKAVKITFLEEVTEKAIREKLTIGSLYDLLD